MKVKDILNITKGQLIIGNENLECENFSKDTRTIQKGDIYIGIKGEKFDGSKFWSQALDNGADAVIIENIEIHPEQLEKYSNKTIIKVENTLNALYEIAKYKRSLYDIPVVAVTGSVGKTSVKDIIYAVLKSKYNVLSTKGNFNNHLGVPLTILELRDHDALVVEMGMNHFGELHNLSNIAKPTIAVITNIGTAHIGNLGSRENILKAKLEILDGMDDGILIINNDNDMLRTVKYNNLITVGIENESDYIAKEIQDKVFSSNFYINNQYIVLPVGSKAFIYNALFAYAVGTKLGISSEEISNSLKSFTLTPHRLELIKTDSINIIDDTYNASLDSVKNGLELLGKVNGRKVFIFADILELDEYGENIHKEIGNIIIENNIDVLITVGNLSKHTYEVVKNNNTECYYFESNGQLLQDIDSILKDGDTILVKGSNGMKLIEVVNYLKNK